MNEDDEVKEIIDLLRKAGYDAREITGEPLPEELIDIKEAVKDAPKHWP